MPNLLFLDKLRSKYIGGIPLIENNPIPTNESFQNITKAFSFTDLGKEAIDFFAQRKERDVILLFVDIANFSSKAKLMDGETLANYLDRYYDLVFKIISNHGGVVEKVIGDGIICVFGEPFLKVSNAQHVGSANLCSIRIIEELQGTEFEVKIACHGGKVMYYQNKAIDFSEYTMIGQPLTDLFRLENESVKNAINFFYDGSLSKYYHNKDYWTALLRNGVRLTDWKFTSHEYVELKGSDFNYVKAFTRI